MRVTYTGGLATNAITLQVTIGTVAVAYTTVDFVKGSASQRIAESDTESGNIPEKGIGTAGALQNNFVVTTTILDFSHIPPDERQTQISTLSTQYVVKGGLDGGKNFSADADDIVISPDKSNVVVTKVIQFL
jgi:hypothetical protein